MFTNIERFKLVDWKKEIEVDTENLNLQDEVFRYSYAYLYYKIKYNKEVFDDNQYKLLEYCYCKTIYFMSLLENEEIKNEEGDDYPDFSGIIPDIDVESMEKIINNIDKENEKKEQEKIEDIKKMYPSDFKIESSNYKRSTYTFNHKKDNIVYKLDIYKQATTQEMVDHSIYQMERVHEHKDLIISIINEYNRLGFDDVVVKPSLGGSIENIQIFFVDNIEDRYLGIYYDDSKTLVHEVYENEEEWNIFKNFNLNINHEAFDTNKA